MFLYNGRVLLVGPGLHVPFKHPLMAFNVLRFSRWGQTQQKNKSNCLSFIFSLSELNTVHETSVLLTSW